jgi:hypothetical protein
MSDALLLRYVSACHAPGRQECSVSFPTFHSHASITLHGFQSRAKRTCKRHVASVGFLLATIEGHSMTKAEWRERIVELREVAENTSDQQLKRRYLDLADKWEEFVGELDDATTDHRAESVS